LAFALLATISSPSFAEPPKKPLAQSLTGTAKVDYEAAKNLYGIGDYRAASLKFRSAYETSKDARLLWNVATCEKAQRHYARVLEAVRQYLEEGGSSLTAQERADAEDVIKTVEPVVSRVRLAVDQVDAKVSVDGEPVGTTPLGKAVLVDVGSRVIRVEKPGYRTYEKTATLTAQETTLDIKLLPDVHQGTLVVVAEPNAAVQVDGNAAGLGRVSMLLPSGVHTVRVTGKGKRPHQGDVVVEDDKTRTVHVTLEREASSGISPWIFVASGAAVLAGMAVGGYFLFRPTDPEQTLPAPGSIDPGYVFTTR
jgi:hypothetical protein